MRFCRADGAVLVSGDGEEDEYAATLNLRSTADRVDTRAISAKSASVEATRLTDENASAQPTTALGKPDAGRTKELSGPKRRKLTLAIALAIALIALAGIAYYFKRKTTKAIESIAVLPFQNMSGDPNTEYLSDGITESLINSLSVLPNVKVISPTSVFRYKGKHVTAQTVASELNVQAVMTGRIIQQGDTLSISVSLDDAQDNTHLWGEQFTRRSSDIFAVQSEIARRVADALRVRLSGAEQTKLTRRYTENEEAYKLYLQGRYQWNRRTPDSFKKAIDYFNQAISLDPGYALAYAGLADCYGLFAEYAVMPPKEAMPKARAAAMKALEIDNSLAEAHASLGLIKEQAEWDLKGSEQEYRKAIELSPNYATAHHWLGDGSLIWQGRFDEAIEEMRRARELDPLSNVIYADSAQVLLWARRYDEAIEQARKSIAFDENFAAGHSFLAQAYVQKGMYQEAVAEFQKAIELAHDPSDYAFLGHAFAVAGRRDEALKTLEELRALSGRQYVSSFWFAIIYMGLGDKDKTFAYLEKAFDEHISGIMDLKANPQFDALRSDPRRADLLRRAGLGP